MTKLSTKNVAEIFEVRAILVALAARRIAEKHTDDIAADLKEGTAELKAAVDNPEQFLAVAYRVSIYVTEKLENGLARDILYSLARQTLSLTRVAFESKANRLRWTKNWTTMVRAVARNDGAVAEAAMRSVVEDLSASILDMLAKAGDKDGQEAIGNV